ncbi:MAG: DUF2243 domain-containing protein [Planctomycetaceae bacterium]
MSNDVNRRPLIVAGTALGIGMGGFLDGIVLHQLLQIHNMVSAKYPTRGIEPQQLVVNLQINMFWDGMFHLMTWVMTAVGLILLWRSMPPSHPLSSTATSHIALSSDRTLLTKTLVGAMVLGWGLFNLVEGTIDHHLLHIHHVTETDDHLFWDILFLASGVLMIVGGWVLIGRPSKREAAPSPPST